MSDLSTYIDTEELKAWGTQLTAKNQEALEIIDAIEKEAKHLLEKWNGNAATGFNNVINDLIKDARKYHNDMKSAETILNEVVMTAESQ